MLQLWDGAPGGIRGVCAGFLAAWHVFFYRQHRFLHPVHKQWHGILVYCLTHLPFVGAGLELGLVWRLQPPPDFDVFYPYRGSAPMWVWFWDASFSWDTVHWDFGDGNSSDERSPYYIYEHAGLFEIKQTMARMILIVGHSETSRFTPALRLFSICS
jgi:hypothetical protein